jgi:hypothetical protein
MPAPKLVSVAELARGEDLPGDSIARAGRRRYTTSKLCNVLCAYELHRRVQARWPERRLSVFAFDPGFMPATSLARDYGPMMRALARWALPALALVWSNVNRVRTSARRLARLAADLAYDGLSGRYFSRGTEARSSADSYNEAHARELWETSSELTGLTDGWS